MLTDQLVSSYSHHGLLLSTVVSIIRLLCYCKLISSDSSDFLHLHPPLLGLPLPQGDLSRHIQAAQSQPEAPLCQPPCLDHRERPYDCARLVPLLGHCHWDSWLQHSLHRWSEDNHGRYHDFCNFHLHRHVLTRVAVYQLRCLVGQRSSPHRSGHCRFSHGYEEHTLGGRVQHDSIHGADHDLR